MPRPHRLNLPGFPQHVTQRGNNRQPCFLDDSDRNAYRRLLCKAASRSEVDIHAYVLMTNHVHLLLSPSTPEGVSTLMQDLGREYVRYFNASHERTGTLWEGRFKSSLVDSDYYCLACYRYIEFNPVRATLVDTACQYPWSSHGFNALGKPDKLVTPHPVWLALGANGKSRHRAYHRLFSSAQSDEDIETIRHTNRKGLPLGPDGFREAIASRLGIRIGTGRVGRPPKMG